VIVSLEDTVKTNTPAGALIGPASNFITIYGQVQRQGKYEVTPEEELTVSQAVLKAGGFSQFAKDTSVSVIRKYPKKGNVRIIVNLRDVMMKGKLDYDIPIRGGDVIIVDEKLVNF
jgi:protein involved in polysaccharide export with SLBB domain